MTVAAHSARHGFRRHFAMIPLALLTLGCAHTSVLDGAAGDRVDEIAAPPAAFEIEDFQADGDATGICTGIGDEGLWRLQDRLVEESPDLPARTELLGDAVVGERGAYHAGLILPR